VDGADAQRDKDRRNPAAIRTVEELTKEVQSLREQLKKAHAEN
jgi:hypothetical protein